MARDPGAGRLDRLVLRQEFGTCYTQLYRIEDTPMIITTTAESFLSALKDSIKIDKKQNIPVLGYVRVTNSQITATDLDNWAVVQFEGTGVADFLLPYHQAVGVLSGEKGPLTIEFTQGKLLESKTKDAVKQYAPSHVKLSVSGCEYTFDSLSVTSYPVQTIVASDKSSTIPSKAFGTLLERTKFAISREESRYTLNGLKLEITGGQARMVATDGHRLAVAESEATGADLDVLVSSSAVAWLYSKAGDTDVTITSDDTHTCFAMGDKFLVTRKMTGSFPNYQAVMPRKFSTIVNIPSADALGKTLTRVAKCADERSLAIVWDFDPSDPQIRANSHERGKASAKLDCSVIGGLSYRSQDSDENTEESDGKECTPITMGLCATYVSEFLKLAGKEPIKVMLKDASSAALFTMGANWQYVVMPMRI